MYFNYTCQVLKVPCHVRSTQGFFKTCRKHKVLPKIQLGKPDLSTHNEPDKLGETKSQNAYIMANSLLDQARVNSSIVPQNITTNIKTSKVSEEKWREVQLDTSKLGQYYLKLSKSRLTSLVVMTSMMGYGMAPSSFELVSFLSCTIGTALVSSAANSINQFLEIPFDAQMSRTRNRVLVQGHLSPLHAIGFATVAGSLGLLILHQGANSLTATLGAANLILYTMIYTPLKRISIINTWVGSIVGAIPPLMGWAACQGSLDASGFILGGILYTWQFPHFNALSWNLRPDYSKAGYRMMAVTNPDLCRRTAFRYTVGITACSSLAPVLNITHWAFGVLSLPLNLYFIYLGFKFYNESNSKNSRKLFRYSLIHLPLLMTLMLVTKDGLLTFTPDTQNLTVESNIISSRKVFSSTDKETKPDSGTGFSGLSLGTTLHAQVR